MNKERSDAITFNFLITFIINFVCMILLGMCLYQLVYFSYHFTLLLIIAGLTLFFYVTNSLQVFRFNLAVALGMSGVLIIIHEVSDFLDYELDKLIIGGIFLMVFGLEKRRKEYQNEQPQVQEKLAPFFNFGIARIKENFPELVNPILRCLWLFTFNAFVFVIILFSYFFNWYNHGFILDDAAYLLSLSQLVYGVGLAIIATLLGGTSNYCLQENWKLLHKFFAGLEILSLFGSLGLSVWGILSFFLAIGIVL